MAGGRFARDLSIRELSVLRSGRQAQAADAGNCGRAERHRQRTRHLGVRWLATALAAPSRPCARNRLISPATVPGAAKAAASCRTPKPRQGQAAQTGNRGRAERHRQRTRHLGVRWLATALAAHEQAVRPQPPDFAGYGSWRGQSGSKLPHSKAAAGSSGTDRKSRPGRTASPTYSPSWSAVACHRFGRAEQVVRPQPPDFAGYGSWRGQSGSKLPHSKIRIRMRVARADSAWVFAAVVLRPPRAAFAA